MTTKVLYSSGFGAGWATWAAEDKKFVLATDPVLVELVEQNAGNLMDERVLKARDERLAELFGEDFYVSPYAWETLEVEEVHGPWFISEHDGYESVEYVDQIVWGTGS